MTQYSDYLLQVFEKLGTPLLAVAAEQSAQNPATSGKEAELMAALLGKSTQLGLSLSELVDMPVNPEESDSARLALSALAAPLVANQYRVSGRIPEEQDLEKTKDALRTVMTYSDNFLANDQAAARLETLDKDSGGSGDKTQQHVRYLYTLIPAINSVMAFPFGQKEQKMSQDVTDRLIKRARQMREEIFPALEEAKQGEAELCLLRSLVMIYSQCHFAEMARLMAAPDQDRTAALSTEPLWEAFETRVAMLEMISTHLVPGSVSQSGTTGAEAVSPAPIPQTPPPVAPPPVAPPVSTPIEQQDVPQVPPVAPAVTPPVEQAAPPPAAPPPVSPPPATEPAPATPAAPAEGDAGNPMSFFSKPPADTTDGAAS